MSYLAGLCILTNWILYILVSLIALLFVFRAVGQRLHRRIPEGGINTQMHVDINGTKQWISIYGQNIQNPVLLYLHGGPGAATSHYDYAFTRKWADRYTVVTWDQRNCGKSRCPEQTGPELTYDLLMRDGLEMTQFLCRHLKKEKITLLGHSWGTIYGCNLVLAHPEYYDCYIGTGQLVDSLENEKAFLEEAAKWVGDEDEGLQLIQKLIPGTFSAESIAARNTLMARYGYDLFAGGTDYNMALAQLCNPYYSLGDYWKILHGDFSLYEAFLNSEEFQKFSLLSKAVYPIPYYNINGDRDFQTNYRLAQTYFDQVQAPRKALYLMKNTTHGLLESKSEEFSKLLHEIARIERSHT